VRGGSSTKNHKIGCATQQAGQRAASHFGCNTPYPNCRGARVCSSNSGVKETSASLWARSAASGKIGQPGGGGSRYKLGTVHSAPELGSRMPSSSEKTGGRIAVGGAEPGVNFSEILLIAIARASETHPGPFELLREPLNNRSRSRGSDSKEEFRSITSSPQNIGPVQLARRGSRGAVGDTTPTGTTVFCAPATGCPRRRWRTVGFRPFFIGGPLRVHCSEYIFGSPKLPAGGRCLI
jgi:hypothetical protein